jgi:hypothetical protein
MKKKKKIKEKQVNEGPKEGKLMKKWRVEGLHDECLLSLAALHSLEGENVLAAVR